jgi:hypothetical protein
MTQVNRDFRIVFTPYNRDEYEGKRRFLVGAGRLYAYIGGWNAYKAIDRAYKSKRDKATIKLRSYGILEFYSK